MEWESILQLRWSIKQTVQSWSGTSFSSKSQVCDRRLHTCIVSFTAPNVHLVRLTYRPHHSLFLSCIVFPKLWGWLIMHTSTLVIRAAMRKQKNITKHGRIRKVVSNIAYRRRHAIVRKRMQFCSSKHWLLTSGCKWEILSFNCYTKSSPASRIHKVNWNKSVCISSYCLFSWSSLYV